MVGFGFRDAAYLNVYPSASFGFSLGGRSAVEEESGREKVLGGDFGVGILLGYFE